MTSEELQQAQNVLQELAKNEIDNPMTNYSKLNNLLKVIKDVDSVRRETWNEEKFEASDAAADSALLMMNHDSSFTVDDIPF